MFNIHSRAINVTIILPNAGQSTIVIVIELQTSISTSLLPLVALCPGRLSGLFHPINTVGELFQRNFARITFSLERSFLCLKLANVLMGSL